MENAVLATELIFNILGGLGLFFMGIGILWYVSELKAKRKSNQD